MKYGGIQGNPYRTVVTLIIDEISPNNIGDKQPKSAANEESAINIGDKSQTYMDESDIYQTILDYLTQHEMASCKEISAVIHRKESRTRDYLRIMVKE